MSKDVLIKNGIVVMPNKTSKANIHIRDGRIFSVNENEKNVQNYKITKEAEEIDASGLVILPGLIDIHVHLREPGQTHKEDIFTGTCAAASGGVTTVCDMPNNKPPIDNAERFIKKKQMFKERALVDYGLYASATGIDSFSEFHDLGAIGLKLYMELPHQKGSPYGNLTVTDDNEIYKIFNKAYKNKLAIHVHLDTPPITESILDRLKKMTPTWKHYYTLQNSVAAEIALVKVLVMAEASGVKLHICHVPSIRCLERIKHAKSLGVKFTCDCVVPFISLDDMLFLGAYGTPYGRPNLENDLFWKYLKRSILDCVITDHAPAIIEEKDLAKKDMWLAPPGVPGLETLLGILLTKVNQGLLSLNDLANIACTGPAKVIGIEKTKGSIEIGKDADLVLVDMTKEWEVQNEKLYTKCGWSPFAGKKFLGFPTMTILRGNIIMKNGTIVGHKGIGKMVNINN